MQLNSPQLINGRPDKNESNQPVFHGKIENYHYPIPL